MAISNPLHDHCNALTTPDAHRDEAVASSRAMELINGFYREDRARRANRMAYLQPFPTVFSAL